jgi:FkbM family methyltransferase
MRKIFLDIGAHTGETLQEISKSIYGFDRIIAFEPSTACFPALSALASGDRRIEICRFGLGEGQQQLILYGSGLDSASTLQGDPDASTEIVQLEDASCWVRDHLLDGDLIVAKLNCEGGEIAILRSWLASDILARFYSVMITFDIRNYPSLRHQEGLIRSQLRQRPEANTCFADDVMIGPSHGERLAHWLSLFGLDQPPLPTLDHYRSVYAPSLTEYSRKRGYRQRAEVIIKERLGYGALPAPVKAALRAFKSGMGMSTERSQKLPR